MESVLQTVFFLLLHALNSLPPAARDAEEHKWWGAPNGRAQLRMMAAERGRGISPGDATDILRWARFEWASHSSRRIFASEPEEAALTPDELGYEFNTPEKEITPADMVAVVETVVEAAEVVVQACWPAPEPTPCVVS